MKKVFYKKDNIELLLELDIEPFASGGEGNLHRIRQPQQYANFVVKLYHKAKRTKARQQKIEYMIVNPPINYVQGQHHPVIWPQGLIYETSGFAGFLMPFGRGEKLEILSMPRIHRNLMTQWGRFDFSQQGSMQLRLSICYNIATAVYQVHATDHYVLVDLKTDNIIIQPNGLISIVDMDSMQVIENDQVLFPATVTTPEYTPPEYYSNNIQPGKHPIFESWDLFSLSIIFYKLLFGIHPYAASCNAPYDSLTSLHQKIEAGLFVHHPQKQDFFKVIPPPHQKFNTINSKIQELFLNCFEKGHHNPTLRPDAEEWCWAIAPSPKLSINRPLPSRTVDIGTVIYSKPLQLAATSTQLLPSIPYQKLPSMPNVELSSNKLIVPQGIIISSATLFAIWTASFGLSFFQVLAFITTSFGMLYASYQELEERKQQKLIAKKLKQLRTERTQINKQVVNMRGQLAALPSKEQSVAKHFEKQQKQQLIAEKRAIEIFIQELRHFLTAQDKNVRNLLFEESKALQTLQETFFGTIYNDFKRLAKMPIQEQLQWLEKEKENTRKRLNAEYQQELTHLTQDIEKQKKKEQIILEKQYEVAIQDINMDLQRLEVLRNNEENRIKGMKAIKISEELRKHDIQKNAALIFSENSPMIPVICNYLERRGIRSAADFIDIDAEGKIKKTYSQEFENIPLLNPERGNELLKWLTNLKIQYGNPNELTKEEVNTLNERFDSKRLHKKLEQIKTEHYRTVYELNEKQNIDTAKNNLLNRFEQKLLNINTSIDAAIAIIEKNKVEYAEQKATLEANYDAQHNEINRQSEEFVADIKTKIDQINKQTSNDNKALLEQTIESIKQTTSDKDLDIILNFNTFQKHLNTLDQTFYETKAIQESLKNISFKNFLKRLFVRQ